MERLLIKPRAVLGVTVPSPQHQQVVMLLLTWLSMGKLRHGAVTRFPQGDMQLLGGDRAEFDLSLHVTAVVYRLPSKETGL